MKKKWFRDWSVIYKNGGVEVFVNLPNSHTAKKVHFRSIKRDARIKWLIDIVDCALTELSKK